MLTILSYAVIILGCINLIRMTFFLVGSDIYGVQMSLRKNKLKTQPAYVPLFTVVIPAHNEQNTIRNCVESVVSSTYPKDKLQIIVIDDGSTDQTPEIVSNLLTDPRYKNVQLVQQQNAGKAHALNNAMKNYANGELVMCLDADSSVVPESIMNAAQHFKDERVVALSSNVKIRPTGKFLNWIQRYEYFVCYQMKRAHTVFNIEYIIGGIGSTFRRSALEAVEYYDTDTITEDIDLTFKLIRNGNKQNRAAYGADVITYTESVLSLKDLIKQRFRWKHGRSQAFLKNHTLFFSFEKKHSRLLTWVYLPYALLADIAFALEPLVLGFVIYIVLAYGDWLTLLGALLVNGTYIFLNIIAEDTIPKRQKVTLALGAPTMYLFFYILSFVEYVALVQSYMKWKDLLHKVSTHCNWTHVKRLPIPTREFVK